MCTIPILHRFLFILLSLFQNFLEKKKTGVVARYLFPVRNQISLLLNRFCPMLGIAVYTYIVALTRKEKRWIHAFSTLFKLNCRTLTRLADYTFHAENNCIQVRRIGIATGTFQKISKLLGNRKLSLETKRTYWNVT